MKKITKMEKKINTYIPWQFDRECSENQKMRRIIDIEKYILQLFEKSCCYILRFDQWLKIMEKYEILLYEYRDLAENLAGVVIDDELDSLEDKINQIKKRKKYCLQCMRIEDEDEDFDCLCNGCDKCWRVELCFCV